MTKQEFLSSLKNGLAGVPQKDVAERLDFYDEMIDDGMEDGLSEEEAVAAVGDVNEVISQIIEGTSLVKLVKERVKPGHKLRAWEIVLLILGFPLWFPLGLVALILLLVAYILIWVVFVVIVVTDLSLALSFAGGLAVAGLNMHIGNTVFGISMIGFGLMAAGFAILLFYGCKGFFGLSVKAGKGMIRKIKSWFITKER